ncbi:hypothetical protein GQ54DRAFT_69577 [Martensiomyces pterosporus]|nr:hypothetical protein GQ54DRAFT_69577 [Martensiomyces pterosporus]
MEIHPHRAASSELSMALAHLEHLVADTAGNRGMAALEVAHKRCHAAQESLDGLIATASRLEYKKVRALEETANGQPRNMKLVNIELKSMQNDLKKAHSDLKDAWGEAERIHAEVAPAADRIDAILGVVDPSQQHAHPCHRTFSRWRLLAKCLSAALSFIIPSCLPRTSHH